MPRLASIDGVICPPDEAKVSVYDRGFLYGDSVFETVRTYGGEPFALDEHLARLERSADRVAIAMPIPRADLALEVRRAVRAARNPESVARVMLTRGAGPLGLDPSLAVKPLRVILVEPLTPLPAALYRDGVAVITVRTQRAADTAAHGAKVGNYLASLLALRDAHAAGAHEALVLDAAGHVIEGTTSNVFLVERAPGPAALITPPEDAGILAGITRAHVLDAAQELGIPVRFEAISPARLTAAAEVFITSSIREILPVIRVDGHPVADGAPGPLTRALHAAFRRRAGLGAEPLPWGDHPDPHPA
ncbi:MAG: aminotransferase class IV [Polyangiaceae bacterium]|nr:aminotransferase class IV [Polyangiaceae bacterium]